jgi:transcriptional regulator with XRE-family HTH domain
LSTGKSFVGDAVSKASLATKALPVPAAKAVELLARDIAIARTRRRIPQRLLAKRMMVSLDTVQRLERGNAGVSLGVVATALWALGLVDRLATLASPDRDTVGNSEDRRRLPRRAHAPRAPKSNLDF